MCSVFEVSALHISDRLAAVLHNRDLRISAPHHHEGADNGCVVGNDHRNSWRLLTCHPDCLLPNNTCVYANVASILAGMQACGMGTSRSVSDIVMEATRALVGVAAQSIAEVSDEVSLAQYRCLVLVHAYGSMPMGDLAQLLAANPSTATRLCDVLENKGLVERAPTEESRRVIRVTLTPAGRSLVTRSLRRRRSILDAALARIPPESQRRLSRGLIEFTEALGAASDHAWALGWPPES
jgi:DNA-binding MarR family transcriptional regulator